MGIRRQVVLPRAPKKIFSGNSNLELAKAIAAEARQALGDIEVGTFSDGEIFVNINETVRGRDVFVIQSTCNPVNNNLMELLIVVDGLKRASAGRINVIIPYFGYARQDRKSKGRDPITAKLVSDLIDAAGAERVITMDLHADQIQGFFNIPVDHLSAGNIIAEYFSDIVEGKKDQFVVVSPDVGGIKRARSFAHKLNLPIAIIEKRRSSPNKSEVMNVIGEVDGKNIIMIDDIIDTAGTIINAVEALKSKGANEVYISGVHGVLSGEAEERIQNSSVKECVITDTIPFTPSLENSKIRVVSVAHLFADAIIAINKNGSISKLFD